MNSRNKAKQVSFLAVLAVAAMVGLLFVIWSQTTKPRTALLASHGLALEQAAPGEAELLQPEASQAESRSAHEASMPAPSGKRATSSQGKLLVCSVQGRFEDSAGRSLAGVLLDCEQPALVVQSDTLGRVAFELKLAPDEIDSVLALRASLHGFAQRVLEAKLAAGSIDLGTIVLSAGGSLFGRVVDQNGNGFRQAEVLATRAGQAAFLRRDARPADPLLATWSDDEGYFRLDGLPVGDLRLWAGAEGMLWAYQNGQRVIGAQELRSQDLLLLPMEDRGAIGFVVLDPLGRALPGAEVRYHYRSEGSSGSGTLFADAHGAFRQQLNPRVPHDYSASDKDQRYRPAVARGVQPGTLDLELRLGPAMPLELLVSDDKARPLPEFSVSSSTVLDGKQLDGEQLHGRPEDRFPGRVVLQLPSEPFQLSVQAPGHQRLVLGPLDPELVGPRLELKLEPLASIRGLVLDSTGQGLGGAIVALHELVQPERRRTINGFSCRSQKSWSATGKSAADGSFVLTLREAGRFYLRASHDDLAPGESGPFDLSPLLGAEDLKVVLRPGGVIEGRVLHASAGNGAGQIVGLSRGDGFGFTVRADDSGRFRAEHLTPGPWLVESRREELRPGYTVSGSGGVAPDALPFNCEVIEGRSTRFDLDLWAGEQVQLQGRLHFSGQAAEGWQVSLSPQESKGAASSEARTDATGRFLLEPRARGTYRLHASGSWQGARVSLMQSLELELGSQNWEPMLFTGSIEGTLQLLEGERLSYSWNNAAGLSFQAHVSPDSDGRYLLPGVPEGEGVLRLTGPGGTLQEHRVSVQRGEALLVNL